MLQPEREFMSLWSSQLSNHSNQTNWEPLVAKRPVDAFSREKTINVA